jgi:hypothetical protein
MIWPDNSFRLILLLRQFANVRQELEVVPLEVVVHVVPIVDGDAAVRLLKVVKPETRQVQYVPGIQTQS